MLFGSIIALNLAGSALAGPYKTLEGLTVEVQAPAASVSSIDDLILNATVTNDGAESVKLLKYATILDSQLPTKSFKVTKDGQDVAFTGIKLSLSLSEIDNTAFTIIPAGESVTVTHQVAPLFNFTAAGAGKYTFEPVANFQAQNTIQPVAAFELSKVSATTNSIEIELSGDLANRELPRLNKRAVDVCTDPSKKAFIDASYSEGKYLAALSTSYIEQTSGNTPIYPQYFGSTDAPSVITVYRSIANENSSTRTMNCIDSYGGCVTGARAYTHTGTRNIYFCDPFFNLVPTPRLCTGTTVDSRVIRGGTLLHEFTHALYNLEDIAYGCSAGRNLDDRIKVLNADNYNCFATQVYADTQC